MLTNDILEPKVISDKQNETYENFFKYAGVGLWIEDGSLVKKEIELLKQKGVSNFRAFFAQNPGEFIRIIDLLKIIEVNEYTVSLYKAVSKDQIKKSIRRVFHEYEIEHMQEELLSFIEGKLVYEYESDKLALDGELISTRIRIKIPQKNKNNWKVWYVTEIDVTEEKKTQRKFSEQIDQFGLIDSFRNKLISVMSHDLRNPFCSILGFSEMLINRFDTMDENKKLDYLKYINQTALQTNQLLSNLLNWARMREDHFILHYKNFLFSEAISLCESQLESTLKTKSIKLHVLNPFDVNLWADLNAICFVIRNIIGNALKFSPDNSSIDIDVNENDEMTNITIRDYGVGMTEEELSKLFKGGEFNLEYFNRQGAGVGLLLCRDFVKLHGGNIFVESIKNEGTLFTIQIPKKEI